MKPAEAAELLAAAERLARVAGVAILDIYRSDFAVEHKADASLLTAADTAAENVIVPALRQLLPGVPVVAEEAMSRGEWVDELTDGARFWLVDPLDGTREFVARNGEFTVNIALVEAGEPLLGVVYAPALARLYAGAVGQGAWGQEGDEPRARKRLHVRAVPDAGETVVTSRSHGNDAALAGWIAARRIAERQYAGSALKFGLVAAGQADVYPRFGRTMEWDTAAGHAVLRAAGGEVHALDGKPLRYGKPGFENPAFVAAGKTGSGPLAAAA